MGAVERDRKVMPDTADDRPSAFAWPPVLLAVVVAIALAIDWLIVPLPVPFAETLLVEVLGALLIAAGGGLVIWSVLAFRAHATTIHPDRGATKLIARGPFAISRNPI
jgi:protein-S-isoprenylcysteine O-methyltransferase Ste14